MQGRAAKNQSISVRARSVAMAALAAAKQAINAAAGEGFARGAEEGRSYHESVSEADTLIDVAQKAVGIALVLEAQAVNSEEEDAVPSVS